MDEAGAAAPRAEHSGAAQERHETEAERQDRKFNDILQELRVVMTGTQLITGFLLAVAFQPKFAELEAGEVVLYLVLVVLATTATMLGLAPVILHRQLSGKKQKDRVVRIANTLLLILLVVVSLVAAGVAMLIFDVTVNRQAGYVAGGVALLLLLAFWTVVPRIGRHEPRRR
ncbi:sodium:proton antiporter [Agromyces luteolus]|uniref:Sodium:proton antiporter n=2 Tax=Agromyces luteolus TaxID=88373 RepID=A0A7C9LC76_9MICO|nr:sodium:proton antiporter [Agromyces luteolus]